MSDEPLQPTAGLKEQAALIYAPKRERQRYPENCVQVVDSDALALAGADPEKKLFAARVAGPFRSSEGFRLFYLVRWLE